MTNGQTEIRKEQLHWIGHVNTSADLDAYGDEGKPLAPAGNKTPDSSVL
jgi:hypothetical protein